MVHLPFKFTCITDAIKYRSILKNFRLSQHQINSFFIHTISMVPGCKNRFISFLKALLNWRLSQLRRLNYLTSLQTLVLRYIRPYVTGLSFWSHLFHHKITTNVNYCGIFKCREKWNGMFNLYTNENNLALHLLRITNRIPVILKTIVPL